MSATEKQREEARALARARRIEGYARWIADDTEGLSYNPRATSPARSLQQTRLREVRKSA
jgi:hypothetical protein